MPDILTLTMNPALDIFTAIDRVEPVHKLRCGAPEIHPGGGGVNVARVLHRLGSRVTAIYAAGGPAGQTLQTLLDAEGVPSQVVPIQGATRESFSVHERSSGQDYRFVLPGPTLTETEWNACLDAVVAGLGRARHVVVSGGLPPGVPADFYAQLARRVREAGGWLVLDSNGAALAETLAAGVYLVKPSLRELRELTGQSLPDEASWRDAARQIIAQGQAQIVALSLGGDGALLVTADEAWRAQSLRVNVASTIGAGDSFVGGLVWALSQGQPLEEAFGHAMAAGAAALLLPGTNLCDPADVERLRHEVRLTPV
ncbi:MAG: 1-phosphofructokinase family hexose kinase [Aquabacterium sp.]|jgi:6-phosphofructokinase 2|uniref:1-phosphofructokinase family hexose kinase n=1 Tax=Aquabacterium sp. TaxID=1872578 RepID=UPI001B5F1A66|nr:1-phosphofructokinase family hexose kinase [Aquabacterium sp.]MBP7132718.1 1-phosphofructokinase family hexose kinase [Aquabacterium sp.]MBP9064267.1 1-phosphofructokinase family hexose kinase [Aquabacterium sp.]MDQ5926646.1 6-phosphofructokinase 2 [Pseudomonadota bacterium]